MVLTCILEPSRCYHICTNVGSLSYLHRLDFTRDLKFCNASISINNTLTMAGDQVAVLNKLVRPTAWLHLGGVIKNNIQTTGFVGCMKDLKVR